MTEQRRVLQGLKRYKYATMIDLKAGYFNVPFEASSSFLSTFITHRGKYRWKRLFFGLTQAPAHFQSVVEDVISAGGTDPLTCRIYIDDIVLFGDDKDELIEQSLRAIQRLATAGFMINLRKSHFCVTEGIVLGQKWTSGGYFEPLPAKLEALVNLPEDQLSKMARPRIYGLLNYYRGYVPNFTQLIEPLRELLSKPHLPWTSLHTTCVKETVAKILSGVPLVNFDPASPLRVETYYGPNGLIGTLLQDDPNGSTYLPIASHARLWTDAETLLSPLALETKAIQETLSKLSYITAYARIQLPCSPAFKALMLAFPRLHPKLCAQLVDIQAYQPQLLDLPAAPKLPPQLFSDLHQSWDDLPDHDVLPVPLQESL